MFNHLNNYLLHNYSTHLVMNDLHSETSVLGHP